MEPLAVVELISAVYVSMSLIWQFVENEQTKSMRRIRVCSIVTLIWILSDASTNVIKSIDNNHMYMYIVGYLSYLLTGVALTTFLAYCETFINRKTTLNRWVFRVPMILMGVNLIGVSVYYFTGRLMSFNNGVFEITGQLPAYILSYYLITVLYAPVVSIILLSRKKIDVTSAILISSFCIPLTIAVIILQITGKDYSVVLGAISIIFVSSMMQKSLIRERLEKEKEQQKQLQEALEAADVANKSKTSFLFNMSHDIRTPMNAILGFTNMAIKYIDDREKAIDYLKKTQQAGNMLLSLINSVLDVSRIESGKVVLDEQGGDVYLTFASIEDTMRELAKAKDVDLSFEISNIKDRYVYCDYSRCTRIMVNVISNAIKYTSEGGYVRVTCEQLESEEEGIGRYCYTVADNGIGMSEEFQKHVFEQFSREKTATVSGIQGTGLGMSVCKSFVDLMGGTITCKSRQGEGTVFTIILPLRIQDGMEYTDPITGKVVNGSIDEDAVPKPDFSKRRVLLVDDNELNREIAMEMLREEGILVDDTDDGTKAVSILKEKGPYYYDCIFMDIQMPIMNGYEATELIRKMYPKDNIPIIALSANAFAEDKVASLAAGMNDHIAKPININDLLVCLGKYI